MPPASDNVVPIRPAAVPAPLAVEIVQFRPWQRRHSLKGYAAVHIPAAGLTLHAIAVHQRRERGVVVGAWASVGERPLLDREGTIRRDDAGRRMFTQTVTFPEIGAAQAFSDAVIAGIRVAFPEVLA